MFESKNAGGWALALVALGLFIGLVLRDLIRKDKPEEGSPTIATMVPPRDRNVDDLTELFERVATQCEPFVVTLQPLPTNASFFPPPHMQSSGVLMSPEGYILTTAELVREARQVTVTLNNKKNFVGEVLGYDARTGVAVVKISTSGLKGIRQGNSEDLRLGQWVVTVGNVAAERHTVTAGIISVKGRGNTWLAEPEDLLQTDAVINSNNIGGALVDLQGRLVGINTQANLPEPVAGISHAIPINMAREVMRHIIAEGKFARGTLEIQTQELNAILAKGLRLQDTNGVLVTETKVEGAAARAGLQRGDVIIQFGERPTTNMLALRELVAATKPGATVPISILRAGAEMTLQVTVAESQSAMAAPELEPIVTPARSPYKFGLAVSALTPALLQKRQLPSKTYGVVVAEILAGSEADLAGMRMGDIIQEWEGKSVVSVKDFRAKVSATQPGQAVLIFVRREQQNFYCVMEIPALNDAANNVMP